MKNNEKAFNKKLLDLEVVIGVASTIMFAAVLLAVILFGLPEITSILIVAIAVISLVMISLALVRIEQIVGFYECKKCHHKYVPTFKAVLFAMHFGRTRHLKCPKCHETSWQKKTI